MIDLVKIKGGIMIGKRKCENCSWYQALDTFGLCTKEDGRVDSDPGFRCKHWSGIKYDRRYHKKILKNEINRLG